MFTIMLAYLHSTSTNGFSPDLLYVGTVGIDMIMWTAIAEFAGK